MGRRPIADRALTNAERKRRWRERHRERLWPEDDQAILDELREWEASAFDEPRKRTAQVIFMRGRG